QRLVRILCKHCRSPHKPTQDECEYLRVSPEKIQNIYTAVGCDHCGQTGYSGRTGIYEVMMLDATMKSMIHDNASESEMEAHIRSQFPSIHEDGLRRILAGDTTIEEVIRVTTE